MAMSGKEKMARHRAKVKLKLARLERLEAALREIAEGDVARHVAFRWRSDGIPSTNDRCEHEIAMYEECANCAYEHARNARNAEAEA